jgi:hypothetical protein
MGAVAAAAALRNKKLTPSVTKAIKASPAGMFPAEAAKAGITMGSKLGQAITKSPTGKMPEQMKQAIKSGQPSGRITDMQYRGPVKESAESSALRSRMESSMARQRYEANKPAQVQKPKPRVNASVMNAVKASPAGMFPAVAAKSGISMGSKLGQAITKSGAGKLPSELKQKPKPKITMTRSPRSPEDSVSPRLKALAKQAMAKDAAWEKKNPGVSMVNGKPRESYLVKYAKKYEPNIKRYPVRPV